METVDLGKAITNAGNKEYKAFEDVVSAATAEKIKRNLSGFVNYLEKNQFKDEE